jgi:hypothetical protein
MFRSSFFGGIHKSAEVLHQHLKFEENKAVTFKSKEGSSLFVENS